MVTKPLESWWTSEVEQRPKSRAERQRQASEEIKKQSLGIENMSEERVAKVKCVNIGPDDQKKTGLQIRGAEQHVLISQDAAAAEANVGGCWWMFEAGSSEVAAEGVDVSRCWQGRV
ncbi:hypothetical protein HBI70_197800 [Parastagonospora nodorum]|nr:hypothetical protein HBH54_194870 [Parastagonospora nodorum]KAH3940136.1 hypothetical protein HBH53_222460 [Parastagonospora nodorum]KAH4061871.1 hypothetical protein HBH50_216550 [Parastagonospora nodorum]KAH4130541.1 hypothetical protein HBH45_198810 [Parastagonospora nodorum]KAH4147889.1 hypothetical protein HBH44_217980 [Parastagonospora nodorum]